MSFPAREQFERSDPEGRLYAYCCRVLHFREPREVKGWVVARALGMHQANVTRLLNKLVARGFLADHPRPHPKHPRRLTLVYDRDEEASA